jgi:TEA/ATTS domain
MHQQEMGKASSSRRRPSDGHPYAADRPKASVSSSENLPSDIATPVSAPSSYLDTSIPFNLPPRRSMKMLKDGSDFVWPDAAHALFVRGTVLLPPRARPILIPSSGLQAWKFINIGSKRTRAPRGEGKTDLLTRYLQSHGVERTKKQVASHLCV